MLDFYLQDWPILLEATASRASIDKRCCGGDACGPRCIPDVWQLASKGI